MTLAIIICLLSSAGMLALMLLKPAVSIKGLKFGTYWMVTVLGAIALLSFRLITFGELWSGLTSDAAINPLKILVLFISMTVLSIFLDETGFFRFLANTVLRRAGGSQFRLFTAFYIAISLVTIFTSNDIIILTFTLFICYFAKNAKVNPVPYLVSEFVAANSCGMFLIIGNPTNIYLATANGIDFLGYLKVMALPSIFAVITAYLVMVILFWKKLKEPITGTAESATIEKKPLLFTGLALLFTCTVLLVVSSYINLEMWLIAGVSAAALTVCVLFICVAQKKFPTELVKTYKRAPWELIPFLISMFALVLALEKHGVTAKMAEILGESQPILAYGSTSVLFANLVNNIPMSVLFSSVLSNVDPNFATQGVYAAIIGSNIGAFLTPVGALAGIMWLAIIKSNGVEFSFLKFMKFGFIIAIPVLLAALGGLVIATAWI